MTNDDMNSHNHEVDDGEDMRLCDPKKSVGQDCEEPTPHVDALQKQSHVDEFQKKSHGDEIGSEEEEEEEEEERSRRRRRTVTSRKNEEEKNYREVATEATQDCCVLVNQVHLLRREFQSCNPVLVARNDLKYGLKLARDGIVYQTTLNAELSHGKIMMETCVICLEDTDVGNTFRVDCCLHRYYFSCMRLHVENKLLHAMVPKCPHDGCKSELKVDSCRKFLLERLKQCIREASIPAMDKLYCPYPKCSALMTRKQVSKSTKNGFVGGGSGTRKCVTCQGLFCINCKVPWHKDMTCYEYKLLNPNPTTEDVKLKSLASKNLWINVFFIYKNSKTFYPSDESKC
ncbi:hypothetical protein Dsin_020118 [Dipteronia sinensis]|uniref:RBR-type E3 ubiquitin transferase n=1 Tax=Dipteronia sinensis TaxID=43782 RepID=A0AAE0A8L2_9ROSI|nr:hypothetical protein Dsin_020118 [Dipteronia sinensis]